MADIDVFYIYIIIAVTGAVTCYYAYKNYAVHRDYYKDQLDIARESERHTKEYYTKRSLVEQKRADDAERYYNERVKLENEKIAVEREKLEAEHEKIKVEKAKLKERGIELNGK